MCVCVCMCVINSLGRFVSVVSNTSFLSLTFYFKGDISINNPHVWMV